jgi:hypothetical protein
MRNITLFVFAIVAAAGNAMFAMRQRKADAAGNALAFVATSVGQKMPWRLS